MIKIKLKCFSQVKYALETDELIFELEDGTTSYEFEKIVRQRSGDKLEGVTLRIAVNQEYVKDDTELYDGDEVVLIPPVQGG
ncbi:MAG: MoaD/ThiS family protein [bacterium TMED46]|jgi:molybdopterin synthase sulfur carrier subunit|nr:MAG: MoaD/ThiS family protein [bacterium TMED46]|tara:strand:+ start:363 stop:608 length:246 start_codon:yes stop_codon:yes gene_type:complete